MGNSPLVEYTKISPHKTTPRNHVIDTISIHCVVGQLSIEQLGDIFVGTRKASSNYGVGKDGRIGMYVEEKDRSYCTSSASNDHRAITIEVACDPTHPYAVNSRAMEGLITLLTDICKRNPKLSGGLRWQNNKSLIGKVDQQNMTIHRWFAAKACPGEYLLKLHGDIANEVNKRLKEAEEVTQEQFNEMLSKALSIKGTGDVKAEYMAEAIEYCKSKGIFNGNGEGDYGWMKPIMRGDAAVLVYNIIKGEGVIK